MSAALAAALAGWGCPVWGASASTKPAKGPEPSKPGGAKGSTAAGTTTQPRVLKPAAKVAKPSRPPVRPPKAYTKEQAEALLRARASSQRKPGVAPASADARPEATGASARKNRFTSRLRSRRDTSKRPAPAKSSTQPGTQPAPATPPPPKKPPEERQYVLTFLKATWDEILDTFCRWTGQTIMGQYPRTPTNKITYINSRPMTYHEALHELNMLLMEQGYWMVREKNHLRLRRLSDWPKHLPSEKRFDSREAFEAAKLDDDDWAMLFHAPKSQAVGELITDILVMLPDNVLRVTTVGETSRLKITGICFYIRQFLELAESKMLQDDEIAAAKLRQIRFYKIERAQAASVQQVLERIVLPPKRRGIRTTVDEADRVDIVLDPMSNTIIVKAKKERHDEIKEMIDKIEKSELVAEATTTFVKLEHARAEDMAALLNPLLERQAAMRVSFDTRRRQRERVYLQADPTTNSLIVLATKEGLKKVKTLLDQFDVETPESKYKRIVLKNARADQILPVVNSIVQSRRTGRRRRGFVGQQLQVMADPQGNALFVVGNPKDIEQVEKLVAEIDAADLERSKAHVVKLKKASPTIVSQGLQALFGGRGRISRTSPQGSFRVIADERRKVLVVVCPEKDWQEIEPQIKEFDDQAVSLDPVMRTLAIKHGDAEEIAQTLNAALGGRVGGATVRIGADRKTNVLFVTTLEPAFKEIESLVKKLDVAGKEGKLEVIPLANANATEVANLITQMFAAQRGSRRFRGGAIGPVIIPDPISNALVVRASKTDLAEIEIQAMRLDDAAEQDGNKPTIIPLEYADPSRVASVCEAMFAGRRGRRSAERKMFFYPTRTGLVVRAPAQQMAEIKAFVKSLDSPESENVEVKTVQLPGQDVEQVAATLERVFGGERRRRGSGGAMSFMPNPSADMLVITAPKKRFEEIDKVIKQYTEGVKVATANMKMFELKNARVDEVAELLDRMLGAKLGGRRRRSMVRNVQILRDLRQNRLIVFAPDDVMKQAEEMIKQLDVPIGADAGGVRWIALEQADASYVASTLNQLWSQKQRRGRAKFRQLPVQIWPEAITNSVLVSAPADEFKEIEALVKKLDAEIKVTSTQPTIIPVRYQEPSYIISMCQEMFLPTIGGPGRRKRTGTESISFMAMRSGVMVRAPQSRLKAIKEFIEALDDPGEAKLTVKRFELKKLDVASLHATLESVFSKMKLQRDEPRPSFMVDQPHETVTVTCWRSRLPEIEKVVEDFKKAEAQKTPSVKEMIEAKFVRATYAASTLEGLLRKQLGKRAERLADLLSIGVEDRQNKVVIVAPPDVMETAKQILAEIDVKLPGATTQQIGKDLQVVKWISIENVDAGQAANTVKQIWEASLPPQKKNEKRPEIRIWAEPITNAILVAGAYGKDFETIERIAKDIDDKSIENPNKPVMIKLEYASPGEVASMIQALFIPPGRRAQRKVMVQTVSGGIVVRAPKIPLQEIQEFVKSYDKPDASGLKIQTFYLPQTNVSELAGTLNTIFGYKKKRRNEPGWSFIPNTSADTLMVLAPETRLKEIGEVIKEYEQNVQKTSSKMQMFDIKHTRANYVVGVLNDLLREKLRRTRGRRAVQQLQISAESRQNKVVVFAPDDVMKQVEEMIKQVDIELEDDAEQIKWIEIINADASEVASTLNNFFSQKRSASYRRRQDSYGIREVRIWPEMVTNSILVSAPKKEFEEIEKLAKKIDDEYAEKGKERVKITPKFVSVGQIESMINQLFRSRSRRRDVRAQRQQIRIIPAGQYSFFLEAPKDKLQEVKKLIEEMDVEGENAPIIKTYKMGNADVRQLARALSQTMGRIGSYIPEPRRGALIVSAPRHHFDRIEKAMEQLKAEILEEELQFEVLTLEFARPSEVQSRLERLVSMQLSRRRSRRDRGLELSMMADDNNNRLFVYAAAEEMALVKKMLEQLDVDNLRKEAELHTIPLKRTDCEYMAGKVQQMFTPEEQRRRWRKRGRATRDVIPIRVVPEPTTNALLITCTQEDFRDIELFVAQLEDAYIEKEKVRELITPKFVSQGQLMSTINGIYNPPGRRGKRYKRFSDIRAIPASGSSFFLEAPKDKMPELKKLIAELDVEDQNRPIVRTYKMKDIDVRQLTRLLQNTMSGKGSFMADPRMGMIIISAPEHRFAQIEEMMTKLQADIEETKQQFEVLTLEFARPSDVTGRLNDLIRMQMSQRVRRRDRNIQLSLMPDDNNNRLFVYAGEEEMALVKKMLEQLDIENLRKEAELHTISLKRTDCDYMAGKIQQVFTQEEQRRRWKRRGRASRDVIPIRVVPEPTTNSLLITCTEEDFHDIELFVAQLEDAYVEKEKVRELITPKFVSHGQLMATINAIYEPPRRRGVRRKEIPDIRAIPASGSSFYLEAPKDKMPELKKLIAELDVEDKNRPVVRTYRMRNVDVRQLARLLQSTMSGKGSFAADPQMGLLIISAPEHRFAQIEEMMTKLQAEVEATRRQFKVLDLKFAKANNISGQLAQLVSTRVGRRRSGNVQLEIIPDPVLNRLFVYAGDEELKLVEEMLGEMDVEGVEPEQQVYSIELVNADCNWVSSMVTQMFTQEELRRRRRGKRGRVVAPLRVLADPMSNRLLVWASPEDYADIEKFVKELDERAKDSKPERRILQPKFIRANELYSMIQSLFLSQQRRRTGQRSKFFETSMIMSGADIILNGPKDRLDEIEAFVRTVDTEDRAKLEIKTFFLPEVDINALVSMLNQLFAQDARKQRGNMLFIPDVQNSELMVSAPKSLMADIEELIEKKQEGAKLRTRKLTMIEIEHTDANYLASMLRPLVIERTRSRRGRYVQPEVTITPETRTNRLLIMAAEAETKIALELIAELDTEAMGLKGRVRTIQLTKADVSYVASTLQTMFSSRAQLRKSRTFTATPVYIVAEPMTDRIFVAASEADFKEIEKLAREMDEAAELKGVQREKIEVKFAPPGQLVSTITQMFQPLGGKPGRRQRQDVRLSVVGPNIIAQAPASKMVEIKKWIKELDVEEFADTQTKFFTLEIARAREIQGIIQPMLQAKAQEIELRQGLKKRRGGSLMVLPDVRNNRLIITAPSQLLTMAEQLIKELDVEDPIWTGETVEIVEIDKAEATQVAKVLQQILRDRDGQEARRPRKGRLREFSGLAVTIVPDDASNTLILKGLPKELERVKELIAQIEQKAVASGMQVKLYRLMESDAEEVAQVVQQMVNQAGGARSKRNPIQVTSNYLMNALFIAGTTKQLAMVQKIIDMFEKPQIDPETGKAIEARAPFEFINLKYSNALDLLWDLEAVLEKQFGKKAPTLETLYGDTSVLMVTGKPDQIKAVRQLVDFFEEKNKRKPPVTRTLDLGELAADELRERLVGWGMIDERGGDSIRLVGRKRRKDLVKEITIEDGIKLREKAEDPNAQAEGPPRKKPTVRRVYRRRDRGVRFVPPSVLGELAAELNGIVCAASPTTRKAGATKTRNRFRKPTTAPVKTKNPKAKTVAKQQPAKGARMSAEVAVQPARGDDDASVPNEAPTAAKEVDRGVAVRIGGILGGAADAAEGEQPRVNITIDEKTGIITIKGQERRVAEIEDLILRLQDEIAPPLGKEMEFRVYEPKYIDVNVAAALLDRVFNEPKAPAPAKKAPAKKGEKKEPDKEERMMDSLRDLMRSRGLGGLAGMARGQDRVRVVPYAPTGYLIVVARPETHRDIVDLLAKVDVPPSPPGDISYFPLVNLDVTEVEQGLKTVLKLTGRARKMPALPKDANKAMKMLQAQIQQLAGAGGAGFTSEQVTITSVVSTNTLIVRAPEEVTAVIEDYIETLEIEAEGIEIEAVALDTADAAKVAQSMTALYAARPKVPGKPGIGGGPRVTVTADAESNTVYVRGPEDIRAEVIARIKQIDAEASEAGKPFRIVLTKADAEVLAPKLTQVFATRKRKAKQAVQVVGDNASNTLIIRAPENLRAEIQELVQALDVESVDIDIQVFPLEHANAVEVHQQMTQMTMQVLGQLRGRGRKNISMDVFAAVPDPRTNALIVTGGPTTFAIVEKILASIDVEPQGKTEMITVVYQLEQAQAADVSRAINQLYRSRGATGRYLRKTGMEPPSADFDTTTNSVMVRATEKLQKLIKKEIIDKLEEFTRTKKIKDSTIELKFAKSDEVAEILTNYFAQRSQGRRMRRFRITPSDIVTIVSEPNSNALLVRCNEENLETIQRLVAQMDREEIAGKSTRVTKVIPLEFAEPGSSAQAIRQAFVPPGGRRGRIGLRDRVDVVPEYYTGALVVVASQENMKRVDDIIAQLDVETAAKRETRQIKLEHAEASEVARQLTQMYTQTRGRTRRGQLPVTVTADERTNSVLVQAKQKDLADVEKLIKTLDVPSDQLKRRQLRIFQLEWAEPSTMAQMINQAFSARSGRRSPSDRVFAGAEWSTGSLVVSASPDNMQLIEQLVKDVDREGSSTRQMHVVDIRNGEAMEIAQALNQMFVQGRRPRRGGQPPITIVSSRGASKIMVLANEADFKRVNEAVKALDVDPTVNEEIRVVLLEHLDAAEALTIMQDYLRRPGRGRGADLAGGTRLTASDTMNALVISGKKENVDQLEQVVKGLDQPTAVADRAPKTIELKAARATMLAPVLTQLFTEPAREMARGRRARSAQQMIPLIMADENTNILIVRARKTDFNLIEQMARQLDYEEFGGQVKIIPVPATMDVAELARTVERVVNQGENYRAQKTGQRPSQVAVGFDYRSNSLIVSGASEQFAQVEQVVKDLQAAKPTGVPTMRIIPLKNLNADDITRVLEQMMERRGGRRGGRRWYR